MESGTTNHQTRHLMLEAGLNTLCKHVCELAQVVTMMQCSLCGACAASWLTWVLVIALPLPKCSTSLCTHALSIKMVLSRLSSLEHMAACAKLVRISDGGTKQSAWHALEHT